MHAWPATYQSYFGDYMMDGVFMAGVTHVLPAVSGTPFFRRHSQNRQLALRLVVLITQAVREKLLSELRKHLLYSFQSLCRPWILFRFRCSDVDKLLAYASRASALTSHTYGR